MADTLAKPSKALKGSLKSLLLNWALWGSRRLFQEMLQYHWALCGSRGSVRQLQYCGWALWSVRGLSQIHSLELGPVGLWRAPSKTSTLHYSQLPKKGMSVHPKHHHVLPDRLLLVLQCLNHFLTSILTSNCPIPPAVPAFLSWVSLFALPFLGILVI